MLVYDRYKDLRHDLKKLINPKKEEVVDWQNQPPLPFDFSMDLPLEHMHVLDFDSKIVLIGGCKFYFKFDRHRGPAKHSKKVYELDLHKEEVEESKSIDDAEFYFDITEEHYLKIGTENF
ncbi:hypothetical protein PIB30_015443 [Stylosanthes scabra]|uniref:Uncharacterized protein n=1 Tax=Stylosanthes scabra TaxID=79078 RepID=A0ABU6U608_9FABA|nr:hypothetical protein [Stylosanthes scabra]